MDNQITSLGQLAQALTGGCGYEEKNFDTNLIEALDKLGEQFGPMGVALAAATRTEPNALGAGLHEMFTHQRDLWAWLNVDRYQADRTHDDDRTDWVVIDDETVSYPRVALIEHRDGHDPEDAARALADHLNRKVQLAKIAQAIADTSVVKADQS